MSQAVCAARRGSNRLLDEWGAVSDRLGRWMSGRSWMTGRGPSTAPDDVALSVDCVGRALDRKLVALRVMPRRPHHWFDYP